MYTPKTPPYRWLVLSGALLIWSCQTQQQVVSTTQRTLKSVQLDSLIGDDDLLGLQTIVPSIMTSTLPLIFRGRQLFDPFVYRLYWSMVKE